MISSRGISAYYPDLRKFFDEIMFYKCKKFILLSYDYFDENPTNDIGDFEVVICSVADYLHLKYIEIEGYNLKYLVV